MLQYNTEENAHFSEWEYFVKLFSLWKIFGNWAVVNQKCGG